MRYHQSQPSTTVAYHKDGSGNKYFGVAGKGCGTAKAGWSITAIIYTGTDWITKYPVGGGGKATDAPEFIFDNVESYTYGVLGT